MVIGKLRTLAAVGAALALMACGGGSSLPGPGGGSGPPSVIDPPVQQETRDEQALYAAEAAYFGVATAVETALDAGVLTGDRAAQVANYYQRGHAALMVARSAHRAGNARAARTAASEALTALGEAQRIIKPSPPG